MEVYNPPASAEPFLPRLVGHKHKNGEIDGGAWFIIILWLWRKNFILQTSSFSGHIHSQFWFYSLSDMDKICNGMKMWNTSTVIYHVHWRRVSIPGNARDLQILPACKGCSPVTHTFLSVCSAGSSQGPKCSCWSSRGCALRTGKILLSMEGAPHSLLPPNLLMPRGPTPE